MPRCVVKSGWRKRSRLKNDAADYSPQAGINTAAFSETLSNTDTSYKFLWLLSLLEILEQRGYDASRPILFNDIFFIVLKLAKNPLFRFNLSFGVHDRLYSHITYLEDRSGDGFIWREESSLRESRAFHKVCTELAILVPYRWIRPFVKNEVEGAGGATRNKKKTNEAIVGAIAEKFNGAFPPPYRIEPDKKVITIHPLWAEYFSRNAIIIKGWCLWNFARYLQTRNPNIPAIINKITTDEAGNRELKEQRKLWGAVMEQTKINCIYSGKQLSCGNFALDHYVPWSFVGHDNLWNLIPALPSANSSKSDNLPDGRYLGKLAETHHCALTTRARHFPRKGVRLVESYAADLKLSFDDLTDKAKLNRAYEIFIPPLIDLAKANRFRGGWVYKSPTPLMDGV